eukprot:1374150-Karenia_brevis.AAC.1
MGLESPSKSPGLGIPGNQRGCHNTASTQSVCLSPGLGIPGNQRGCHSEQEGQLLCPKMVALSEPPVKRDSTMIGEDIDKEECNSGCKKSDSDESDTEDDTDGEEYRYEELEKHYLELEASLKDLMQQKAPPWQLTPVMDAL